MRVSTTTRLATLTLITLGALRLASAAEPRSPFSLGDLSSLAETAAPISPAPPVDSGRDLEFRALYAEPFSVFAATGAAGTFSFVELGKSYLTAKIGPMWFFDGLDKLDTGFNLDLAYGYPILGFLSLELQSGYIHGSGSSGSTDTTVSSVPIVVNARVSMPVLFFEVYGGMGIGGYYIHSEVDTPGSDRDNEDFVMGGDIFGGVGFGLGPFLVGLEAKYIATAEANFPGADKHLRGFALLMMGGLSF